MEELTRKITDLFLKYGVKSVTMDDIAKELGISKKTLYLTFTDKKDVVMKSIEYSIKQQLWEMNRRNRPKTDNAIDQLLKVSEELISWQQKVNPNVHFDLQKYYPEAWAKIKAFRQEHVFEQVRQNIIQGISEGVYRTDFNVDIICHIYVSHIDNSYSELLSNSNIHFEELLKTLFVYHLRGIASKNGVDYIEQKAMNTQF